VEATLAAFDRIDRHNAATGAYCLVDQDGALAAARASEERWHRGAPISSIDGAQFGKVDRERSVPVQMKSCASKFALEKRASH